MPSGDTYDRLAELEQQVSNLRSLTTQLIERDSRLGRFPGMRLATTGDDPTISPGSSAAAYPLPTSSANTFWITFVDGNFTDNAGYQAPTITKRSEKPVFKAHNIWKGDSYIEKGSLIAVFPHRGKWFFCQPGNRAKWIAVRLATLGSGTEKLTAQSVVKYWQGELSESQVDVFNQEASVGYMFEGKAGAIALCSWNDKKGRYEIVQMECKKS